MSLGLMQLGNDMITCCQSTSEQCNIGIGDWMLHALHKQLTAEVRKILPISQALHSIVACEMQVTTGACAMCRQP